ncbi:MSHA biogenesis protein MshI [Vibrio sp. JC009]|uniref:MSHA biogenesis protein MshI n=1 Tax=Vibrio sp. JC009 TaxID=2912314 RepID=UPI0023AEDE3F|nr:MSHA biogenesis protein MshI [Vibrio sp. JC009]WED21551.1 MSHA biogenesis protein MshI [Vibrio sp. JC009]
MNISSLISRLTLSKEKQGQISILILGDALYISGIEQGSDNVDRYPIDSGWESTLSGALSASDFRHREVCVTLASDFYQNYQIEKPQVPVEEWPGALPFLLKDLISEKVTDIVADGYPLPDGNKAQAYVLPKTVLTSLNQLLNGAGAELVRIVPEDEAWGYVQEEFANFMLLHRSEKANFKIGAYTAKQNRFQRIIRGVTPPLTGTAMGEFQLDNLALELQRSTDYLSSQIRDVSFNHLYICCDEESQSELIPALSERLAIKVLPLIEGDSARCGDVLAQAVKHLPATGVNLYPELLKPKKEILNLTNMAALWGVVVVLMGALYGYQVVQNSSDKSRLSQLRSEMSSLSQEVKGLQKELAGHKPSPAKLAAAERLKKEIEDKEKSLSAIHQFNEAEQAGYSGVMQALAKLESQSISISSIVMDQNQLNLAGLAKTPGSVPRWVKQFKNEVELVGRSFEKLVIGRNEQDVITFSLIASRSAISEQTSPSSSGGK